MKIICLIGPSGSGKTTVGKILKSYNIPEIVSHTTRAPRFDEIDGITYHFVDNDEFAKLDKIEEVIYAGNKYCTSKKEIQSKFELSNILFCIVTYEGYESLYREYGKESVISVFIHANIDACASRMIKRGDKKQDVDARICNFEILNEFDNQKKCDIILDNTKNLKALKSNIINMLKTLY